MLIKSQYQKLQWFHSNLKEKISDKVKAKLSGERILNMLVQLL